MMYHICRLPSFKKCQRKISVLETFVTSIYSKCQVSLGSGGYRKHITQSEYLGQIQCVDLIFAFTLRNSILHIHITLSNVLTCYEMLLNTKKRYICF